MLRKLSVLITASALFVTFGTSAFAHDKYDIETGDNWLDHVATASAGSRANTIKGQHLGSPAAAQFVDRQIELQPGEKYVNVTRGETVLIKADGKAFAWKFDTLGTPVFVLSEIAPKNVNVKGVQVYVTEDPRLLSD